MKRQYLELVGVLVTSPRKVGTYHIDYIYKWELGGVLEGTVIQKGFDFRLHIPFQEIVTALSDAYAPALRQRWTQKRGLCDRTFLALRFRCDPNDVNIEGKWTLDCEW